MPPPRPPKPTDEPAAAEAGPLIAMISVFSAVGDKIREEMRVCELVRQD